MKKLYWKRVISAVICIALISSIIPAVGTTAAQLDYELLLFNEEAALSPVTTNKTSVSFDSERSAMKISSVGEDPFIRIDYSSAALSARAHTYVVLVYEIDADNTNTTKTQVFFSTSNNIYESADACHSFTAQKGRIAYEIIDLSTATYWISNIHKIRIDLFQSFDPADSMYIYAVGLAQTAGEAESMAKQFVPRIPSKEHTDYGHLLFDREDTLSLISTNNTQVSYEADRRAIKITPTAEDPFIRLDYKDAGISAATHKYIALVYEFDKENTNTSKTQIFLSTTDRAYESPDACHSFYAQKGSVSYEIVDLSSAAYWTGNTYNIRIDPFQTFSANDYMYIYAVVLTRTYDEAKAIADQFILKTPRSVPLGDSDLDGKLTARDSFMLSRYIAGVTNKSISALFDINGDGTINAADSLVMKKIIVGSATGITKDSLSFSGDINIIGNAVKGSDFSLCGSVSSGFGIASVTAEVCDSATMTPIRSRTVTPKTESFDIASLSDAVDISSLDVGSYRLRVFAEDGIGTSEIIFDDPFTINAQSMLAIGNGSYDPVSLSPGQAYSIGGTVTSNYKITRVSVDILDRNGNPTAQSATALPNASSYDISALDSLIKFASLASGDYYFCITASDASGTTVRLVKNLFTVLGPDGIVAAFQQKALDEWVKPVRAKILSVIGTGRGFGAYRTATRQHAAIDYYVSNGSGTPVYAMQSGTVIEYLSNFYYGTAAVAVQHADGSVARYCEISTPLRVGDTVTQGQHIATIIGNTLDGGTMLHLELYLGTATGSLSRTNTTYDYVTGNYNRRRDILNPEFLLNLTRE